MLTWQGDKAAEFVWVGHKSGVEVDVFEAEGWVDSVEVVFERQNWPCFTFPCILLLIKM